MQIQVNIVLNNAIQWVSYIAISILLFMLCYHVSFPICSFHYVMRPLPKAGQLRWGQGPSILRMALGPKVLWAKGLALGKGLEAAVQTIRR